MGLRGGWGEMGRGWGEVGWGGVGWNFSVMRGSWPVTLVAVGSRFLKRSRPSAGLTAACSMCQERVDVPGHPRTLSSRSESLVSSSVRAKEPLRSSKGTVDAMRSPLRKDHHKTD